MKEGKQIQKAKTGALAKERDHIETQRKKVRPIKNIKNMNIWERARGRNGETVPTVLLTVFQERSDCRTQKVRCQGSQRQGQL